MISSGSEDDTAAGAKEWAKRRFFSALTSVSDVGAFQVALTRAKVGDARGIKRLGLFRDFILTLSSNTTT
jgi:hypothetical protein